MQMSIYLKNYPQTKGYCLISCYKCKRCQTVTEKSKTFIVAASLQIFVTLIHQMELVQQAEVLLY